MSDPEEPGSWLDAEDASADGRGDSKVVGELTNEIDERAEVVEKALEVVSLAREGAGTFDDEGEEPEVSDTGAAGSGRK